MVPSYSRKAISGQNNYLGTVTSPKMSENEMGDRGSKSEFLNLQPKEISVKEQRVDGSYFGLNPKLRCTLTGFERNYPIKIPSKQFNNKSFSTFIKYQINPWFLTGFTDGEGCFSIKIQQNAKLKTNWAPQSKSLFFYYFTYQRSIIIRIYKR
jgi:hypothetical protein